MRIRPSAASAALAAGTLLLSACGSDSPLEGMTGPEVTDLAADALEDAGAVRVAGAMLQDGEETELDLQLQGDDAAGSISLAGVEVQIISVDGDVYLQAPPDFWQSFGMPPEVAEEFDGEWVTVPGDASGGFAEFSLAGIADEIRGEDDIQDETRDEELDGEPVVIVEQEDGSTLAVADDEPPYPLELTSAGDDEGTLTFSDFGEEEDITAPEDVLDLDEVMGG